MRKLTLRLTCFCLLAILWTSSCLAPFLKHSMDVFESAEIVLIKAEGKSGCQEEIPADDYLNPDRLANELTCSQMQSFFTPAACALCSQPPNGYFLPPEKAGPSQLV